VKVLVEAGASLTVKDQAWGATPLGWAEYYLREPQTKRSDNQYAEIADYLRTF
jgi:hypothetical protein